MLTRIWNDVSCGTLTWTWVPITLREVALGAGIKEILVIPPEGPKMLSRPVVFNMESLWEHPCVRDSAINTFALKFFTNRVTQI
jgi:hypothetical protein